MPGSPKGHLWEFPGLVFFLSESLKSACQVVLIQAPDSRPAGHHIRAVWGLAGNIGDVSGLILAKRIESILFHQNKDLK